MYKFQEKLMAIRSDVEGQSNLLALKTFQVPTQ